MLKTFVRASAGLADFRRRIADDKNGAALVEYSVLIGLITVAAVASVSSVGTWVAGQWSALVAAIGA
jgi:pilus assembly protein Flp/PilA